MRKIKRIRQGISVIIPAHNEEQHIDDCLRSLLRQTYRGPFEVIVVDNASTDGTSERVRQFQGEHPEMSVWLAYEGTPGSVHAWQRGLELSRYDIVARTDADSQVFPDWLKRLSLQFRDPSVIAVGGTLLYEDKEIFSAIANSFHQLHSAAKVPFFCGANIAVRRWALFAIGGFSTELSPFDDFDLCLRLAQAFPADALQFDPELRVRTSMRSYRQGGNTLHRIVSGVTAYLLSLGRFAYRFALTPKTVAEERLRVARS